MDAYSSLLNLNVMSSLRTGNIIIDMIIAMFIPFVASFIARFFQKWWPEACEKVLQITLFRGKTTTVLRTYTGSSRPPADLDENAFLQEVVMHYVSNKVKPDYPVGSYRYTRLAVKDTQAANTSLPDYLRANYFVQTVPGKDHPVEVKPTIEVTSTEKTEEREGQEGGGGGGQQGKKNQPSKKNELTFSVSSNLFDKDDGVTSFAKEALLYYQEKLKMAASRERFLYQPMIKTFSLSGGGGGGDDDEPSVMECQRYPLSREKTFNTLFFPDKQKLLNLIRDFENKTGKFSIPGFSHKLVLLLHGPPGTGKTSLVKAIAEHTSRHIMSIPLSRVQTNSELLSYIFDGRCKVVNANEDDSYRYRSRNNAEILPANKVVYMLEDVDAASEIVQNKKMRELAAKKEAKRLAKLEKRNRKNKNAEEEEEKKEDEEKEDAAASEQSNNKEEEEENQEEDKTSSKAGSEKEESCHDDTAEEQNSVKADDKDEEKEAEDEKEEKTPEEGNASVSASPKPSVTPAEEQVVTITEKKAKGMFQMSDRLSMKGLLEAFGGILDATGRIIILTTNHIEHLDAALLRPGVVTMKLHMGNFNAECGAEMIRHYFSIPPPGSPDACAKDEELVSRMADVIRQSNETSNGFSPAEVEQLCAEKDTLEELLDALNRGTRREIF